MVKSKITLIGFYQFTDGEVFDTLDLPAEIDKEAVVNNLLLEFGECEVYYSDLDFFKNAIGLWSKKWRHTIERWIKLINTEYEPLWNIDRFEDVTDTPDITTTSNGSTTSNDSYTAGDSNTHKKNTYDDDTWHNTDRDESESSSTSNNTSSGQSSTRQTGTAKHVGHYYGNGGITSSQTLFQEEQKTVRFNIYNEIAELFARDLLIDSFY